MSLVFIACNKDGDIVIENPGDNNKPEDSGTILNYKVIEYLPAPGQYINDPTTGFSEIFTMEEACRQAEARFQKNLYVSLGSWGGYIVVKFDKSIVNSNGNYDFSISSNAFDTSNEPGIVWVMQDSNGNGIADDTWYELKGSYFGEEGYERNYWVKYYRPEAKESTPWEDSNGESGVIEWMGSYHKQDYYYPAWIAEDSYTLYGSRLPVRAEKDDTTGIWTNYPYEWGYADNFGSDFIENERKNQFRISDAVTEDNNPANLTEIDFVKVQTAINGNSGWLGENSTEVSGFFVQ